MGGGKFSDHRPRSPFDDPTLMTKEQADAFCAGLSAAGRAAARRKAEREKEIQNRDSKRNRFDERLAVSEECEEMA